MKNEKSLVDGKPAIEWSTGQLFQIRYEFKLRVVTDHTSRMSTCWTLFHFCLNPLFQDNSDTNMLQAAEVS